MVKYSVSEMVEEIWEKLQEDDKKYIRLEDIEESVRRSAKHQDGFGFDPDKIHDIIRDLSIRVEELKDGSTTSITPLLETNESTLRSEDIAHTVSKWVQDIRKDIFSIVCQPFEKMYVLKRTSEAVTDVGATAWIEDESDKHKKPTGESQGFVEYYDENRYWLMMAEVGDSEMLRKLSVDSTKLSYATGWLKYQAVEHILTGRIPSVPRVTFSQHKRSFLLSDSVILKRQWISIEIQARDLSRKELDSLYAMMRKGLDIERTRMISDEKKDLFHYVRDNADGIAKTVTSKTGFWKEVLRLWKKKSPHVKAETYHAVKKGYERTCKRLNINPHLSVLDGLDKRKGVKNEKMGISR